MTYSGRLFKRARARLHGALRGALVLVALTVISGISTPASAQQSLAQSLQAQVDTHLADDAVKVDLLVKLADANLFVNPERGEEIANRALELATRLEYPRGVANANRVLGRSYQFRGLYGEDVAYLATAYSVAEKAGLTDVAADVLRNMGSHYLYTGEFAEALEHFAEAVSRAKLSGKNILIAEAYLGMGTVYNLLGNHTDAEKNFQAGLKVFQDAGDMSGVAITYANLGEVRENIEDYDSAILYFDDALQIMEQVGDITNQAFIYASLGSVHRKRGDIAEAIKYYYHALEIGAEIGDLDILADVNSNLGGIYLDQGNLAEAGVALQAALKHSEQGGNREEQLRALHSLSEFYEKTGDFEQAYEQLVLHNILHDLLFPEDYSDRLAQLQMRFESTERRSEIDRLQRRGAESELIAERDRAQRNIAMGVVLVVIIVLLGVGNGYAIKTKAAKHVQRQNQQLLDVGRELENANRVKSEILANTSHEIRTPLNGILGLVTLLLDSKIDKTQRHQIKSIEHSGRTLLHLVNDILDLSKIEANKLEIDVGPCNLRAELSVDLQIWREQAEAKGLVFKTEIADDLPRNVIAANARIQQILGNFVSNAIKFTESGSVTVRIRVLEDIENYVAVSFEVEDTGIGIARDQHDALFERFSQIDTSSSRSFGGTGLGLAISRELVEMMGGEIGVTGDEGEGSTFWFRLDLEKADEPVEEGEREEHNGVVTPDEGLKEFRIILAEDNEINRTVIEGLVRRAGYDIETAVDGEEVLARLRIEHFDLVLMDIQMPHIDGVTATKWIRAMDGEIATVNIVALTANAMAGDREKYLSQGFDDYISKPIEPVAFSRLLNRYALKSGSIGGELPSKNGAGRGVSADPSLDTKGAPAAKAQDALQSFIDTI